MTAPATTTTPDGYPVLLQVETDLTRNRLTTFFRALLVIPHLVVLYLVNIAVVAVVFVSWFAALVTGRNPDGMRDFVIGGLRWQTRVTAYYSLLTDEYPPFSLDAGGYPVDVAVPPGGALNRAAVFFRLILVIPAYLLTIVVGLVLNVLVFVAWLTGVFAGTVPAAVYGTIAGCLQWSTRLTAYYFLLVPTYPSQPFGPASLTSGPPPAGAAPAGQVPA